jgi:two-component system, NarL family, nitrate/nitrite response regulator NarL
MDANSSTSKRIRLLVAVSVRLYRDGLSTALSAQSGLSIAGTAASAPEALTIVRDHRPDVAIVDVSFDEPIDLIRALRVESSSTCIIAFAVREDIAAILEYAEAGADGFVTAQSSISELVEAIKRTVAGELLCSPRLAAQLLRRVAHRREPSSNHSPWTGLTIREGQVLGLIRQGQSNKEIASALNISEATVKNHVHHVLEKLQVTTRGQAAAGVRVAAKAGLPTRPSARHGN